MNPSTWSLICNSSINFIIHFTKVSWQAREVPILAISFQDLYCQILIEHVVYVDFLVAYFDKIIRHKGK